MALDAVRHNLMILGEAAKRLPPVIRDSAEGIEWRKIAGLRDVLAHGYFSVDLSIIRDVLETKLEALEAAAGSLLDEDTTTD